MLQLFIPVFSFNAFNGVADVIVILYLLLIPALSVILGAASSGSPYAGVGLSREMVTILAVELPFVIVLLAVAALLLLALAGYVVSLLLTPLYKTLLKSDLEWLYFALTGVGAFLISFMLTAFYAQGSIFEAKDNEMLLSMPVRPSAILGSRLGALYFLNFFFAAARSS